MNYKDLILYKTLYEEKNITHTAKRLFLSQPAISDRIKRFEAEFGCQLVVR
ncbi:MAG: LysR family transcriptional regulator, partial [Veillonella sp.]|nr:LysR family transcriptional regulator [Veillonella sp.]